MLAWLSLDDSSSSRCIKNYNVGRHVEERAPGKCEVGSNEFFSRKLNLSRSLSDVLGQDQLTNIRSRD